MVIMVEIYLNSPQMHRLHDNKQIKFSFICATIDNAVKEAAKSEGDMREIP